MTDIRVRQNDAEFVSSSTDGSCIVWNLKRYARSQVLFAGTMFNQVCIQSDFAASSLPSLCKSPILKCQSPQNTLVPRPCGPPLNPFFNPLLSRAPGSRHPQVRYRPDEAQILTCGSDRKVHYWETFDASLIRELEVSVAGSLNALDISPDGRFFVTGGDDKLLKVLEYNEGGVTHIGVGHSDNITRAAIDPEQRFIVTATQSGSIFVWKSPLPLAAK